MAFPLGILCINVLGGFSHGPAARRHEAQRKTVHGGIQSAWNRLPRRFHHLLHLLARSFNLYHTGDLMLAGLNILLNAVICICAVWAGYRIVFPRTAAA